MAVPACSRHAFEVDITIEEFNPANHKYATPAIVGVVTKDFSSPLARVIHRIVRTGGWRENVMHRINAHRLTDDLGAGVGGLDRDHAELMSLAHQFSKLRVGDDAHRSKSVLHELLSSAEAHWAREEAMLRSYGYPHAEDHARLHRDVQEALQALLAARHLADVTTCEDIVVRMVIDDHRWKWWFLDTGIRPKVRG